MHWGTPPTWGPPLHRGTTPPALRDPPPLHREPPPPCPYTARFPPPTPRNSAPPARSPPPQLRGIPPPPTPRDPPRFLHRGTYPPPYPAGPTHLPTPRDPPPFLHRGIPPFLHHGTHPHSYTAGDPPYTVGSHPTPRDPPPPYTAGSPPLHHGLPPLLRDLTIHRGVFILFVFSFCWGETPTSTPERRSVFYIDLFFAVILGRRYEWGLEDLT